VTWQLRHFVSDYLSEKIHRRGRLRLKCDGTRAENRFGLSAKRTSPFKSTGVSVQSTTGRRAVHISLLGLYCSCKPVCCNHVTLTGYPLHSLVSPSLLPCVTVCHHISNAVYSWLLLATIPPPAPLMWSHATRFFGVGIMLNKAFPQKPRDLEPLRTISEVEFQKMDEEKHLCVATVKSMAQSCVEHNGRNLELLLYSAVKEVSLDGFIFFGRATRPSECHYSG
jgi:hypothetical protein